ncbi:hypothetical protein WMY93_018487 [Mugilogobius chulae]|uniref:PLA2c domain-containing protein n=1 Tax=Mugilogobius chulae TaxID=88201 RepID=A0AAW0NLS3_9GOBI
MHREVLSLLDMAWPPGREERDRHEVNGPGATDFRPVPSQDGGLCHTVLFSLSSLLFCVSDSHPDAFPNHLTPSDRTLRLIDSGHLTKISCPPVLRPERLADVIIVLSNGWEHDTPFLVLQQTAQFCDDHKIPFPSADYVALEKEPRREVYVIEDPQKPKAPIVLHFPLVNASFKEYKAPGEKRQTEAELAAGQVDVSSSESPYLTKNMSYSESDFDALIDLTCFNVLQSKDVILSAISRAMKRRHK